MRYQIVRKAPLRNLDMPSEQLTHCMLHEPPEMKFQYSTIHEQFFPFFQPSVNTWINVIQNQSET